MQPARPLHAQACTSLPLVACRCTCSSAELHTRVAHRPRACSIDKRSPVLLNSEAMEILVKRGALSTDRFSTAAPVEKQAAEYLAQLCNVTAHDRAQSLALRGALEALRLASSEVFQLVNLKPRSLVEVYLVVEDLDERFGEEAEALADKVLALMEQHFPQAAA